MLRLALVAPLLFLGQVVAGGLGDSTPLVRRDDSAEYNMRRFVDSVVEPVEGKVIRRQTGTPSTGLTVQQWDDQTMAACTTALEKLNGKASNDAGMAVCYNLPSLDNSTGVFQADLRLFKISEPTGKFTNIPQQNVMVGLAYVGATVSPVSTSMIGQRSVEGRSEDIVSLISWPRSEKLAGRATIPIMAQAYAFVGQINKDLVGMDMTADQLEKLLVPTVTLTGIDAAGLQQNATLNTGEASFVSGVLATEQTVTQKNVSPPIQTLVVASNAPFVVPGLNILIFPIGGVITGVWAVLLMSTIGYGTYGRMQFRDQYRRRAAIATKGSQARI